MKPSLGRTRVIPLRKIFPNEATDFTVWLAKEENLEDLGEAIGMSLELEAAEMKVGSFSADIVCKNNSDKSLVVIENQLEKTDHDHLGKVITYGAGLDAITMIWVTPKFRKEHRAALKWLNQNTNDKFKFFGIEIEIFQIGDSLPAPKFNLVVQPTDWSKPKYGKKQKISKGVNSPLMIIYYRYWQKLAEYLDKEESNLRMDKPKYEGYHNFRIAPRGIYITVNISNRLQQNIVEIYLGDGKYAKAFFHLLKKDKEAIESELGFTLDWRELPENKASRILFIKDNVNPTDEKNWAQQNIWFKEMIEKFDRVFTHRAKKLDPSDWNPDAPK